MSDLKSLLLVVANKWGAVCDAPLSRPGKLVAGDANFFARISGGGGVQLDTVERFSAWFIDPANWPDQAVASEAIELRHRVCGSAALPGNATGKIAKISGEVAAS